MDREEFENQKLRTEKYARLEGILHRDKTLYDRLAGSGLMGANDDTLSSIGLTMRFTDGKEDNFLTGDNIHDIGRDLVSDFKDILSIEMADIKTKLEKL